MIVASTLARHASTSLSAAVLHAAMSHQTVSSMRCQVDKSNAAKHKQQHTCAGLPGCGRSSTTGAAGLSRGAAFPAGGTGAGCDTLCRNACSSTKGAQRLQAGMQMVQQELRSTRCWTCCTDHAVRADTLLQAACTCTSSAPTFTPTSTPAGALAASGTCAPVTVD